MNNVSRAVLAVAVVAVAGCTTNLKGGSLADTFAAEGFLAEQIPGSDYNAALARAYQQKAAYNATTDVNWLDTTVYMSRSRSAQAGTPPELFQPAEYGVNGDLEAKRSQTLAAVAQFASVRPEECAQLAAGYDFLVEQTYQQPGTDPMRAPSNAAANWDSAYAACTGGGAMDGMTVFFDFDRFNINAAAEAVIQDVVQAVGGVTSALSVVGHTDTVGSLQYNQTLSERRATAVANRMVQLGVDPNRITTAGRSWLEPAVDTGPNVRSQANRRVEITVAE
jgi:outer membrane protein OmpA-like peptidoglycan-associated protein